MDVHAGEIRGAEVVNRDGKILSVTPAPEADGPFILPGFVDAHVHIESSMLPPAEFGRQAAAHGTVATVSDPHEIANVLGVAGVEFMLENAKAGPLKVCFGAPSCVPATTFETAGAELDPKAVAALLERPDIGYLSEVMNYPGVLAGDPGLLEKIAAAKRLGKRVDGHAPGVRGEEVRRYAAAGIETDHESVSLEEALDKLAAGMWILIREGSAAKNYEALKPLLKSHPKRVMFCTDDLHPDALRGGHINRLVARAIADGADLMDVLRAACVHPVEHYSLPVGLLRPGDPADFILARDLESFQIEATFINGECVARNGEPLGGHTPSPAPNRFEAAVPTAEDIAIACPGTGKHRVRVIEAANGQLVTGGSTEEMDAVDGSLQADPSRDLLKLVVLNRYQSAKPAVAIIRGFGLRRGAIASSVAHDSHNVIATGADDASILRAMEAVIAAKGGVAVCDGEHTDVLPLPIAGLMSDRPGVEVMDGYARLRGKLKEIGTPFDDALMTLSFMALLVIPDMKLSDLGLFSGKNFAFEPLLTAQRGQSTYS